MIKKHEHIKDKNGYVNIVNIDDELRFKIFDNLNMCYVGLRKKNGEIVSRWRTGDGAIKAFAFATDEKILNQTRYIIKEIK